jgi:hypothetical protein
MQIEWNDGIVAVHQHGIRGYGNKTLSTTLWQKLSVSITLNGVFEQPEIKDGLLLNTLVFIELFCKS